MKIVMPGRLLSLMLVMMVPLICCDLSFAETGYVSDMLILTMREGPGSNFNVIRTLRSNEPLEIMEKGETHFKVRTAEGDEGWVEKQYITMETPKAMVIDQLNRKIADLEKTLQAGKAAGEAMSSGVKEDIRKYGEQVAELTASLKTSETEKSALQKINTRLESELEQTKASLESLKTSMASGGLADENEALKGEVERLTRKVDTLTSQGNDPLKTGVIKWFLSGAAVLLAGWLMGKSMVRSRKRSGGSLLS